MIYLAIFACALALVAVAFAAGAWIISSMTARKLDSSLATLQIELEKRFGSVATTSPAKLAAEVAELSERVDNLREIHQRFAGKVWARIGRGQPDEPPPRPNGATPVDDPELAALLSLQGAPVAKGG